MIDSFWRAALCCLQPHVMVLSIVPLLLMVALAWVLGYYWWDAAVAQLRLESDWAVGDSPHQLPYHPSPQMASHPRV